MRVRSTQTEGFTLIELSIVLVIIGLVVGGVLVGQSLIGAAAVRAQISQIEKFNTAANTFFEKYGYLPGDIPDPNATQFGFIPRGTSPGEGDGNGVISSFEGVNFIGSIQNVGETVTFWVDLSTAHLIEGGFSTASETAPAGNLTEASTPALSAFLPRGKIGQGNYVYVWSDANGTDRGHTSYFGLSAVTTAEPAWTPFSNPALTPSQAYAIDNKIDDGLPQSGNAIAQYINHALNSCSPVWAAGGGSSRRSWRSTPSVWAISSQHGSNPRFFHHLL